MDRPPDLLHASYPALYAPTRWGNVTLTGFHLHAAWPAIAQVQSVNVVPFIGDRCLVIVLADGGCTLPGGTRERDETLEETGRRELLEETGSTFVSCTPFAYWECHSADAQAWRPFLAHPHFTRAIAWADVTIIGPPTNPVGAEQVADVMLLPVAEAVAYFRAEHRPELGDLYALAAEMRGEARY